MLRSCITTLLLFSTRGLGLSSTPTSNNEACLAKQSLLSLPMSSNTYDSVCPLGYSYLNKMYDADESYVTAARVIGAERKEASSRAQDLAKEVLQEFHAVRYTLFNNMSTKTFNELGEYLKLMIDLSVNKVSHEKGKGECNAVTKASIANSLIRQLDTKTRENIQLISVGSSESLTFSGGGIIDNPSHVFAIFNSNPISSQALSGNKALQKLMMNLKPSNPKKPVIACDAWAHYHGEPDNWLTHIQQGKDHFYGRVNWDKIRTANYTLPPMNTSEWNQKQRDFFEALIRKTLKPDRYANKKEKGRNNKKASLRKI